MKGALRTPAIAAFLIALVLGGALSAGPSSNTVASAPMGADQITRVTLATNDLVYDPGTQKIWASVPSRAGSNGNSVTSIDPYTGEIGKYTFVGSEPNKLALSDNGQNLYVGLDGAAAVRRFDVATQTAGLQFALGAHSLTGPYYVEDMGVLPGNPWAIAVSRRNKGFSPQHEGVAVYDDGVMRPNTTARHTGSNVIEFSSTASTLYGYNNETSDFGFRRMSVDASGVSVIDSTPNLITGYYVDIAFDAGRVYATSGRVVDPATLTLLGTFSGIGFGAIVRPDSAAGRAFFLTGSGTTRQLLAFDQNNFTLIGSLDVPNVSGTATSLIRWGTDGLAFRTSADQVFLISSWLVRGQPPSSPSPSPSPSASPSPAPNPAAARVYLPLVVRSCPGPALTITPSSQPVTPPATYVYVDGSCYTPNGLVTHWLVDPTGASVTPNPSQFNADANGQFALELSLGGNWPAGTYTYYARDVATGRTASAQFRLTAATGAAASSAEGPLTVRLAKR